MSDLVTRNQLTEITRRFQEYFWVGQIDSKYILGGEIPRAFLGKADRYQKYFLGGQIDSKIIYWGIDRFQEYLGGQIDFRVFWGGLIGSKCIQGEYMYFWGQIIIGQKVNTSELQIVVKSDLGVLQWDSLNCIRIAPGPLTRIPYLRRFSFRTIFKESNKEIIWKQRRKK